MRTTCRLCVIRWIGHQIISRKFLITLDFIVLFPHWEDFGKCLRPNNNPPPLAWLTVFESHWLGRGTSELRWDRGWNLCLGCGTPLKSSSELLKSSLCHTARLPLWLGFNPFLLHFHLKEDWIWLVALVNKDLLFLYADDKSYLTMIPCPTGHMFLRLDVVCGAQWLDPGLRHNCTHDFTFHCDERVPVIWDFLIRSQL